LERIVAQSARRWDLLASAPESAAALIARSPIVQFRGSFTRRRSDEGDVICGLESAFLMRRGVFWRRCPHSTDRASAITR
jgi:hypothetical protein